MRAKPWSNPATTRVALERLDSPDWGLDWRTARVADVGAGRGHLSQVLGDRLRERGLDPRERIAACDLIPASFEAEGVDCLPTGADGTLPFDDDSFDAVLSIEVIEHVEDQFAFLRELARVAKPGAPVLVTTPNTHNMNSRLRSLVWGFPLLFDPLSLDVHDPRECGGHVHPISPWFLAYTGLRAGLEDGRLLWDRRKRSALFWAAACAPALLLGRAFNARRLARKKPAVAAQNTAWLGALNGLDGLTSRTAILEARAPR